MSEINLTEHKKSNPFLQPFTGFDQCVPFDKIKVEHFLPAIEIAIDLASKEIQQIKNNSEAPNFENTILALEQMGETLDSVVDVYSNLEISHADENLQALATEIYPKVTAFSSDLTLDPKIFERVKFVFEKTDKTKLNLEQKTLLEKKYKSFVRNGALLSVEDKESLREIDQELSILAPKFSENVLKSTNSFELWISDKNELIGLPEGALEAAAHAAEQKGKKGQWFFGLQMPSYLPLMTYAQNRILREKVWKAYSSRAFNDKYDNQNIIKKIVLLKYKRAQLLGYKNHAEFVLDERMAKNSSTVFGFLEKLLIASKVAAQKDYSEVVEFAKKTDGITDLQAWDFAFYSEKLKENKYAFNEEDLRPFFQLERVVDGVFEHARKLYGLKFIENKTIPVYHEEVKAYEVYEEKTNKYMGLFYTDYFPRETKKGGAWMSNFRGQGLTNGKIQRPHITIVCNFTKPTPTKPSLLTYDEVRTLFHEFGHALHGMLSDVSYKSISGTNVFWDFVELPSQIMENWVGEKEGLDLFAKHYQTSEQMPLDLIEKIKASNKFQSGWFSLRQLQFGTMDMKWYTTDPSMISDVDKFESDATSEVRIIPRIAGTNMSCTFSHIFAGGYSAGYYSYKWAEVLDADAFEFFKEHGIFNEAIAQKFKDNILSRGGTEHPMDLYIKFRGREPDPNALLRREGLI